MFKNPTTMEYIWYHVSARHLAESGCEHLLAAYRSYGYASRLERRSRTLSASFWSAMGFLNTL